MSTPTEPAAPAAPSSAASAAKPISASELSQAMQARPPGGIPAGMRPPEAPAVTEQKPSPQRPDFREALKARVLKKPDATPAPEAPAPTPEPPKDASEKKVVTFEAKVEPKKAETSKPTAISADDAPPPVKAETETPVPDEHKRVLPHDKPDTAKRIKAILAERDAANAARDAAKKELDAAKAAKADPEEIKKLREEYDSLKADALRLRRLHDIKSDAEFNKKYDEPVKQIDSSISDTLKKYGFGEGTLKAIESEGGFAAFSRSSKTFAVTEADPENPGQTRKVSKTAAQLAREWIAGLDLADSEAIKAGLGKQQLLASEKAAAIEQEQKSAREYYEAQGKSAREAQEAANAAMEKNKTEYAAWLAKAETDTEFLKDREIAADATPEQRKAAEDYNTFNAQLRSNLRKDPTNALEYGQLKLEAAESHHLRRVLGERDAQIAALQEQLKNKSAALRTTPKAGSLLRSDAAPAKKEPDMRDPMGSLLKGLRDRVQSGSDE